MHLLLLCCKFILVVFHSFICMAIRKIMCSMEIAKAALNIEILSFAFSIYLDNRISFKFY